MNQPVLWSSLLVVVVVVAAVRWLAVRRPFVPARAAAVDTPSLVVAAASSLALVFHCSAMFFTPWVLAVPGTDAAVAAINAMGTASQVAYWVPAALLVIALRRVWLPALGALTVCLGGVGVTMYYGYTLTTHLWWLGAVIVVGAAVFAGFVSARGPGRAARGPSTSRRLAEA